MKHSFEDIDTSQPVLVLGASGLDVIGLIESELKPTTSNPAKIRQSYGGVARNIAENLARLGQPVRLITTIGDDTNGSDILEYTVKAGVDVSAVLCSKEFPTGYYMGIVDETGVLQFAVDDMRIMQEMTPDYLKEREELFKSSSLVFIDANLPKNTIRTAISLARRAKIPVCADPTSSSLAEKLPSFLPKIYLVTPNGSEASVLTGLTFDDTEQDSALEAARALVNIGVAIALVTLAEFGVVYATSETTGYLPAIRTPISDPTGAGDAMTAAVIFALLNEIELDDAIRLGVSAASLTLRNAGSVYPEISLEALYDQLLV